MANTLASVLIDETLDNLSRSSTATTRSGATLSATAITWLNRTMLEITGGMVIREGNRTKIVKTNFVDLNKHYQMSTVDGTKNYSFPSNYNEIITIRAIDGTSSHKLRLTLPHVFDKAVPYPEGESEDRPSFYIPRGNSFDLFPIPDDVYVVQCHVNILPTTITATTDTIDFEPNKDDLIVAGMTYRGFRHIQMYEDSAYWKLEYRDMFIGAVEMNEDMPDWEPQGQGFDTDKVISGNYWSKPFILINP